MTALGGLVAPRSALPWTGRLRRILPQGGQLPEASWRERHRWIVRLLWVHTVLIPSYGLTQGFSAGHILLETLVPVGAAVVAAGPGLDRRTRTVVASLGLLSCSGILVHLSGGLIEMHFHFFVMVAVVSLYQDWLPFLTAIAYVFLQHGVFGALTTGSVYNHPDAAAHPWRWAAVHASFIAAESIACLTTWRLNESLYASDRAARLAAEQARADLSRLVEATDVLTSSFDTDVMLQSLVELVVPAMADGCAIHLLDEQTGALTLVASTGDTTAVPPERLVECVRRGAVLAPLEQDGRRGSAVVPVTGRAGLLGALSLSRASAVRTLDDGAVRVASELGRRAGIAVENARLYGRERSVALTLQHALLPERLPQLPGLESAARYVAGGPGVDVGGDWYDVLPLARGRLLLVMGDVVGRGEKAAALMGQLRSALRSHTLVDENPAALLTHLNRLLDDATRPDMATLLCALLDPEAETLSIANAGHPPAALRDPQGDVRWLAEATDPPLGAVPRSTYSEVVVTMTPGSTLLLYTDGVVEERTRSLDVGLDQLAEVLAHGPQDSEALCEHVLDRMLSDRRACDDAAVLAVRLLALGDHLEFELPRDITSLEPLRATLGRWLRRLGATPDETYEVLLATCEAAANGIVHARGPAASHVHLEACFDDQVHIEVRDYGSWRPPRADDGGRGLEIMESVMDDVRVEHTERGTCVRMRRRLGAGT